MGNILASLGFFFFLMGQLTLFFSLLFLKVERQRYTPPRLLPYKKKSTHPEQVSFNVFWPAVNEAVYQQIMACEAKSRPESALRKQLFIEWLARERPMNGGFYFYLPALRIFAAPASRPPGFSQQPCRAVWTPGATALSRPLCLSLALALENGVRCLVF